MMFKELFQESESEVIQGIKKILKNKAFKKNVKEFDNNLYFEISDTKSALRLQNRLADEITYDSNGFAGGEIGFYKQYMKAIFDTDAQAYLEIRFPGKVPQDIMELTKADTVSDTEYQKRFKALRD